jgi:hypothetical protein
MTVRVTDDLRAQIDEAAKRAHLTRNAWVVGALRRALSDEPATPKRHLSVVNDGPQRKRARVVEVNAFDTEGVDALTGEPIPGTIYGMHTRTVRALQSLGYEVVE